MANYNIDVKAKVNVSQLKSSIQESLNKTTIPVKPTFTPSVDDNNIKSFRNTVANYFSKEPIPIVLAEPSQDNIINILNQVNKKFIITPTIKFDSKKDSDFQNKLKNIKDAIDEFSKSSTAIVSFFVDVNSYNELFKILNNIKNEKQNVSKIDIKFAYNEQEVKKLEDLFHDLNGGIEQLDKGAIEISFAPISDEYLVPIKTKIDQYFKDNPITLTIAESTDGVDLKSLIESFQEYQKTIKAITVDGLENQRASLRIQANDLKEYYNKGITSAQEYRDKLKALLEDQQNDAILSAKGSAKTREDLARELSRIEVQIAVQTKAEQERIQQETADSWKKSIDDAFESLQSGGSFKKFQKELESLKDQGLELNISGAQEYYDKVLKDGTEYITNLKEQNKQIGTMKGEITRLFNLVSEGKADISKWDDSIEKWKSKDIFKTEQVQEHFKKLSTVIDSLYKEMVEKQKKEEELLKQREKREQESAERYTQWWINALRNVTQAFLDGDKTFEEFSSDINRLYQTALQEDKNVIEDYRVFYEEAKKIRDSYYNQLKDKEIDTANALAIANRRQQLEEYYEKQKEYMSNALVEAKQKLQEGVDTHKHALDEAGINVIELGDKIKKTINETNQELNNQDQFSNAIQSYYQEISQIVDAFRQGAINIEQAQDEIWEKMSEAKKEGIIPQEVFDNTKKLLNGLEEEAGKTFDAWRKKQEKLYDDLQASTEKQKKYDENVWKDKAESVQEMYDKQQISAEQYINRIKSLLPEAYEKGYDSADKYAKAVDKVEKEQAEAGKSADDLGNKVNNLGSRFDNVFKSLMRYFGVTKIFDAVQGSFSKMIQEVRDLDVELTEFSKVTDLTSQQTEKFIDNAYILGDTVARTGTEVVQATTLFKKMGYDIDESMQFAKDALMWTNVADGIVGVESATNMLISTMKAFEQQGISSTHIIDALNEVSNNYSTSSSALSENLSTVAATLAVSGTSFEQTIGLMTAGIEIMPDKASKVANGLKTISQRIRQIDGDTADKLDEFLGSKRISRYDKLTGQLRGTYEILGDVAGIWDKLTENERQYIGEVMAGKNQITVLNALMMNFATAINATETAMNSAGSAARENERVLDSIQGHIQRFQSAFEELSHNLINSEVFKQVVDFGTNLIKILNSLTDETWKLVALFTGAGITGIVGVIQKFSNGFQEAQKKVESFNKALEKAQEKGERLDEVFKNIDRGQYFDNIAGKVNLAVTSIGLFITALTTMVQIRDNIEAEEERRWQEEIDNRNKEINKINELKTLEEEYLKSTDPEKRKLLYEKIHDIKVEIANLDIDGLSRTELLSGEIGKQNELYNNQLAKISSINLQLIKQKQIIEANEHEGFGGIFKHLPGSGKTTPVELNDESIKQQYLFNQDYDNFINNASISIQNKIDNLQNLQAHLADMISNYDPGTPYYEMYMKLFEYVKEDIKELQGMNDETASLAKEQAETILGDLNSYTEEQLESMSQLFDAISTGSIEDMSKALLELQDVFGEDLEDNFLQEIRENLSDPDVAQAAFDLVDSFLQLKNAASDVPDSVEQVGVSLSEAFAMIDEYASQAEILAQAQDDITNSGVITAETLKKIADAGLEAYLTFDEETGSLVVNTQAFYDNTAAIEDKVIAEYIAYEKSKLDAEIQSILKGELDESTSSINDQTNALNTHGEAALADAEKTAQSVLTQAQEMLLLGEITEDQFYAMQRAAANYRNEIQAGIEAIKGYFGAATQPRIATPRGISHDSPSSDSDTEEQEERRREQEERSREQEERRREQEEKKKQQEWIKSFETEHKKLKELLDSGAISYEEYYDALEFLNETFFKDRVEFEEQYLEYQNEIFKGRKKYLEDQLESYFEKGENLLQHQLNMDQITEEEYYEALTQLYESYYTDREKYEEEYWKLEEQIYNFRKRQVQELESQLDDIYSEIEDLHEEYIESLERDAEEIETTIGYAIDVIDEEISKLQEEKDAINEANEALQEQIKLQELQDALEKAKQKKTRVYRKGQGFVYEQDIQAISEAQTALDEYKNELQHKKRLSMIDEEINRLESYKQEWKNIVEQYKKAQEQMTAEGILGENARERILNREYNAVGLVGLKYEETQKKIEEANDATIEDLEAYIGDEDTANTLSYEIKRIKDKIDEIKGKTVEVNVDTGTSETDINNIISSITSLREELESEYSTQTLDDWLEAWKRTIREAYDEINDPAVNPPNPSNPDNPDNPDNPNPNPNPNPSGLTIGDRVEFTEAGIQEAVAQSNGLSETYVRQLIEGWGDWEIKGIGLDGKFRVGPVNSPDVTWAISANGLIRAGETPSNPPENPPEDEQPQIQPGTNRGDENWDDPNNPMYWTGLEWLPMPYQTAGNDKWWYNPITNAIHEDTRDLNGYASGTLGTDSKIFKINENGIEALVTPDGTVISTPTPGYGVIKNEYTKRLTDFASDPLSFLSKEFSGYRGNYQNNQSKNEVININGNLTLPNVTDGESFINSIKTLALQYTTRR